MLSLLRYATAGTLVLGLAACVTGPAATPVPTPAPTPTTAPTVTPTPTLAPTTPPEPTPTQPASTDDRDFLPRQRSVWDTQISPGETLGTCTGGIILPVYGLVQITPTEDGLEWKNQEPRPYAMTRIAPNTYRFAGISAVNNGIVTMTVTFLDETSLIMLREFTPNDDPGCVHRHEYTGAFKWFR